MKFFFADNLDAVDPDFNFLNERSEPSRNRQAGDQFAHEILGYPPYDGMLVSRAIIEGPKGPRRYSQAQRFRVFREGIREFLRYPELGYSGSEISFPIMGDCGAFSYIDHHKPPYSVDDTIDFYTTCGFTHGVSPDHIILGHNSSWDDARRCPLDVKSRAELTASNAIEYLRKTQANSSSLIPIGVVQSWSAKSAVHYAKKLVAAGYEYIGLGGLAASLTSDIYDLVGEVASQLPSSIKIHIFGFSRIDHLDRFQGLGIHSFDSTSPLIKSFKDERHNYFNPSGEHYLALKVPASHENAMKRRIQSGNTCSEIAKANEQGVLGAFRGYARGLVSLEEAHKAICNHLEYLKNDNSDSDSLLRTLRDRPWEKCECAVCTQIGCEVVLFRGLNRNKRRGFHNLHVFYQKLSEARAMNVLKVPCMQTKQSRGKVIYSFIVNGKDISKFADVSRIRRNSDAVIEGYQRPEVHDHISEIKNYLDSDGAILPNSIVIAFDRKVKFTPSNKADHLTTVGTLEIPITSKSKPGLIVDGQQRVAALRQVKKAEFPVSVVAFKSSGSRFEREQFILVNNTRPLPKSLVYELLPSIGDVVPPKMKKRQRAYRLLEPIAHDPDSPFYHRIKTVTSSHFDSANIKDLSILKMIENSSQNGVLFKFGEGKVRPVKLLKNYWSAVKRMYPDAWDLSPRFSRLTHGVGIVSMGYIMDAIAFKLRDRWEVPPEKEFYKELKTMGKLPWTEGVWVFSDEMRCPWNGLQNTSAHIDVVTNYLIRRYRNDGRSKPLVSSRSQ